MSDTDEHVFPEGRVFPMNSKRLRTVYLKAIAEHMGLPTRASADEIRQLIEGKLAEEGREPRNVQVVVRESAEGTGESGSLYLVDEKGIFVKCGLVSASTRDGISMGLETRSQQEAELNPFAEELESAQHRAADAEEKLAALVSQEGEIEEMAAALRREKERYKRVWLLQCEQLKEHDEALALKDEEIATLREIVRTRGGDPGSSPNQTEGTGGSDDTAARVPDDRGSREGSPHRVRRCGRAPPVDPFTGENPEVQLDDWLPALTRASQWNTWNVEELLMQFAGHLRGRALLEWSLLEDEEKSGWDTAVAALRRRLDPGTKVLAAQDFRHAIQGDSESVPDYIRRLEKTFRIAYGRDKLSKETREAILYGQLHDGLRSDLMHNPAVSGALTYKELCMGARNEELRKAEMKKRRQYRGSDSWNEAGRSFQPKRLDVRARQYVPKRDRNEQQSDRPAPTSSSSQKPQTLETRTCHNCGKVGHLYRDCMSKKKESSSRARYSPSSKQVTSEGTPHDTDDPLAYLQSSDSEEDTVNLIRIHDKGSCPQCARVEIQGVPAWGIIDSGADITIMGKELFKTIASVRKLKKKDFKKPDKVPKTYSRQPFTLDGRMELEITFADKVMTTTVYVKMDAADQLLLSEGVCRQLGILQYHPAVRPWEKRKRVKTRRESENPEPTKGTLNEMSETPGQPRSEEQETVVPTVRVLLLHTVNVPPLQRVQAQVKIEGKDALTGPIVFEPTKTGDDSIVVETSLLASEHGIARLELSNPSGFTQCLEGGAALGEAMEAVFVFEESDNPGDEPLPPAPQSDELEDFPRVSTVTAPETEEWREQKMMENFEHTIKLPENERIAFCEFLKKHHTAFSLEDNERGETDLIQLEIDTGEASPKKQRPRRMPFALREEVSRQLRKMQDAGVIRPSSSSWASPVVLVRKKDGTYRFCVDYRELNAVTKPDTFPLPRVDDLLDQLGDTRYFSTLDLAAGYWQIKVHPDSQPKTAFVTPQGLHEFQVMPFGLTNAPAVFQRLMQKVLLGLNPEAGPDFVCVYIDDVLVFSKTLEDHLKHLELVLDRLVEVGLKLKPSKCEFIREEVAFLGHVITPQGLKTSDQHVTAIRQFPTPRNVREVRQFLGLSSYYRRFVKSFAQLAQPLHALTRKGIPFAWTEACQEALDTLKQKLCGAPVLAYPKFTEEFVLETDASLSGVGAILSQQQPDGKLHPVAYASRALSPPEVNYGITELETLAVVWAVAHFRTYLYGQIVTIYTDHAAVKAVLQNPNASGKHARWWTKVYGSGLKEVRILYRPGRENMTADALSRNPQGGTPAERVSESEFQVFSVKGGNSEAEEIASLLALEHDLDEYKPNVDNCNQLESLAIEQRKDDEIREIISYMEDGELPPDLKKSRKTAAQATQFVLSEGILYFLDAKRHYKKRAVVPSHLRKTLIEDVHGGPLGGHFAANRLYNTLVRSWWWDGMYRDVEYHCKNCPQCAIVTGAGRPGRPPLKPIPVSRPFQILGVDIMDLPRTEQGNKHVIVFQDLLTKWPVVFPMPDQKSVRIVKLLVEEIIPVFGVPEALLSDRGTNLLSHLMQDVCGLLGIKKINTTAYHPQCNGLIERFNRTLKTALRKHAAKFGAQWDKYLHGVLWAYRNTPHESTNEKPSFLLFGTDCRYPTEAAWLPPTAITPIEVQDYREELMLNLSSAREIAAEAIQSAQSKYKKNYDRKTDIKEYRIGDWVLIRFPHEETGAKRKLSRPWHGPYRVISSDETGISALKVYAPHEKEIRVHQSRVTVCPPGFPAGWYWYGDRRSGPGRPPKWVDRLLSSDSGNVDPSDSEDVDPSDSENADPAGSENIEPSDPTNVDPSDQENTKPVGPVSFDGGAVQQDPVTNTRVLPSPLKETRTRTRKIVPPDRFM